MLAAGWKTGAAPLPPSEFLTRVDGIVLEPAVEPSPGASVAPTPGADALPKTAVAEAAPEPPPPAPPAGPTGTFIGPAVNTEWGKMQVQIVVNDGRIVDVKPLIIGTNNSESISINSKAVPKLEQKVLSAQTWNVGYVSGASSTSMGYTQSVRGAMTTAGI